MDERWWCREAMPQKLADTRLPLQSMALPRDGDCGDLRLGGAGVGRVKPGGWTRRLSVIGWRLRLRLERDLRAPEAAMGLAPALCGDMKC